MNSPARAARALDQLSSLLRAERLPERVRRLGAQVQTRLSEPIRLAVVGWPEAQPVALVNRVLGGDVLPEVPGLPPAELSYGASDAWDVVTAQGDRREVTADGFGALDPLDLALLRRTAPLPLLQRVALRVVALEGDAQNVAAALRWSTRDADMLLWCTHAPEADSHLRSSVPEALQDHSVLAVTGGAAPLSDGFVSVHMLSGAGARAQTDAVRALRSALLDHISRGRREDLECAVMLLEQYLPRRSLDGGWASAASGPVEVPLPPDPPQAAPPAPEGHAPETARDAAPPPEPTDAPQATTAAAIIDMLADRAKSIEHALAPVADAGAEDILAHCVEALADAAMHAEPEGNAFAASLAEAADLTLLIQMEAGSSALPDVLALMVQARHICEEQLCA